MGVDGGSDRFDGRRANRTAGRVAVDPTGERNWKRGLGHHVVAVDSDRGRSLEAQELGIIKAGYEDQLDRGFDYSGPKAALEVPPGLLQVRTVFDG